mmetsp:Transcript_12243/g.23773  ORF Transcript_12243/g.23773 Transcript_12243/m.23773 type:complete len:263 (+) Transcript_12243:51-839(+)
MVGDAICCGSCHICSCGIHRNRKRCRSSAALHAMSIAALAAVFSGVRWTSAMPAISGFLVPARLGTGCRRKALGVLATVLFPVSTACAIEPSSSTQAATAALLESGPQVQRAVDKMVLEIRPGIEQGDWSAVQTLLLTIDTDILEPVKRILVGNEEFYTGNGKTIQELQRGLLQLKQTAILSDRANTLKAWDACAQPLNRFMASANKFMAGNIAFMDVQQFAFVTADPEKYLASCWEELFNGTGLEEQFAASVKKWSDNAGS